MLSLASKLAELNGCPHATRRGYASIRCLYCGHSSTKLRNMLNYTLRTRTCLSSVFILLLIGCSLTSTASAKGSTDHVTVTSPDGKNQIDLRITGNPSRLLFSVTRNGKTIVNASPINVRLAGSGNLTAASMESEQRSIDQTTSLPWGKSREIRKMRIAASNEQR